MAPNIIYLHSHDTGRYIQPYGHAIATPNLQRLAEDGILFRQAFAAAPTCSPSRAALLTGQWPHNSGMLGLAHRGFSLNDYSQHLVHTLRAHGYQTALFGVQHIARDPATIGYDQVWVESDAAAQVAPKAAEYIRTATGPFFMSIGFGEVHREFPDAGAGPHYSAPPRILPDTPETRRDMASFNLMAQELDRAIGIVRDAIAAAGIADETLLIYTTDHGIAFPGMKCTLTDHGIGISLIVRGPGGFTGGRIIEGMVSHIDIFPTICDLLGIDAPPWLQGRSFMPLVRDEAAEINEAVYAEVTYHAAYEPQRAIRTRRWKYIRRFDGRRQPVLPNIDDSLSKDVLLRYGLAEREIAAEELYDLAFDPGERHNCAADPAHEIALEEMRARLAQWMHATNDPLLLGPAPLPPGGVANNPDDLSPNGPLTVRG